MHRFSWEIASPIIIVLWALGVITLEHFFPYDRGQKLFRKGFFLDFFWYTLAQSYVLGWIISALIRFIDDAGGFSRLHLVSDWPVPLQLAFFWVTHDFYIYWFHRLQHNVPWLWRVHEAHHSGHDVDWLSGSRSHPLEILINQSIEYAPIVLLGAAPEVALMKGVLDATWGMYIHSNIDVRTGWLQYVLNGPEMHRWHHSKVYEGNGFNFATKIAAWDWIFGTAHLPKGEKPIGYGLGGDAPFPDGYFKQTFYAFRYEKGIFGRVRAGTIARILLAAAAVGLFAALVPRGALIDAVHLVARTGPSLVLALLPISAAFSLDALAQRGLLARLGRKVSIGVTLLGRLASEAVALGTQGGGLLGEPVTALVLARRGQVPAAEGVALCATRRVLVMRAHALWIVLSALAGWGLLSARSRAALGVSWLPWLLLASALLPLGAASGLGAAFASGSLARRALGLLSRVVPGKLAALLRKGEHHASAVDSSATGLLRCGARALAWPWALMVGVWACEAGEAYAIIHLLGGALPFAQVMAIESCASILRAAAFFAPAGLGVQDIGYLTLLGGSGDPHAVVVAAGFVIVKRGREALTIAAGLGCLAWSARKARRFVPAVPTEEVATS